MSKLLAMSAGMLFESEPRMLPETTITNSKRFVEGSAELEDSRRRGIITNTEYADALDGLYSHLCDDCNDDVHITYEDIVRGLDDATKVDKKAVHSARLTVVAAALKYAKQPDVSLRLVNDFMPDRFMDMLATAVHEVLKVNDVNGIGIETRREIAAQDSDRESGFMALELDRDVQQASEACLITSYSLYESIQDATLNFDKVLVWNNPRLQTMIDKYPRPYGSNAHSLHWHSGQGHASWVTRAAGSDEIVKVPESRKYIELSPSVFEVR